MIYHGDLFDVLPTLDAESVDACVTDPPYGIGFMGKEWDSFKPELGAARLARSQAQREKNRAFYEDNPNPNLRRRQRSPALSASAVEYDMTATGMRRFQDWNEKWAREVFRVLKPGAHLLVCGAPRSFHRMTCGLEDAGFVVRDCLSWLYGQGFPKSLNLGEGQGTALKPGWEPIVLARKPFSSSVADVLKRFGTGTLNIDACRIDTADVDDYGRTPAKADGTLSVSRNGQFGSGGYGLGPKCPEPSTIGRWPANVCLDEEAAAMLDEQSGDRPSAGEYKDPYPKNARVIQAETFADGWKHFTGGYWAKIVTPDETFPIRPDGSLCEPIKHRDRQPVIAFDNGSNRNNYYANDSGGASRFFYVAKPSREERDYGTHGLITKQRDDSRKEGNPGGDNPRNRGLQPRGNFHPTVKPVELMRWLVRLVTPVGGTVLDPFLGSGTTGMACRYEQRNFIGIEREAEYLAIAQARITAVTPLFAEGLSHG